MTNFRRIDTTANRLKVAMDKLGKKQADLVRETGIDKGSMSHYVNGKYEPKQDVIFNLAKALDVSEMWLWGYDCAMERPIEQKNNDAMADIIVRMRTDGEFFNLVDKLNNLNKDQIASVMQMLQAFTK